MQTKNSCISKECAITIFLHANQNIHLSFLLCFVRVDIDDDDDDINIRKPLASCPEAPSVPLDNINTKYHTFS